MNLRTFFNPENLLEDKNQLFPCLHESSIFAIFLWSTATCLADRFDLLSSIQLLITTATGHTSYTSNKDALQLQLLTIFICCLQFMIGLIGQAGVIVNHLSLQLLKLPT